LLLLILLLLQRVGNKTLFVLVQQVAQEKGEGHADQHEQKGKDYGQQIGYVLRTPFEVVELRESEQHNRKIDRVDYVVEVVPFKTRNNGLHETNDAGLIFLALLRGVIAHSIGSTLHNFLEDQLYDFADNQNG